MLERILANAGIYSAFGRLIGAERGRRIYVDRYIKPRPGYRVLDIGCGPADILDLLPTVKYCGFDVSSEYIDAARKRFGPLGDFRVGSLSDALSSKYADFDVVLATGVLHHLGDQDATALFRLAYAALKPDGVLVTLDGCFVDGQSRVVRALLRNDRGQFVRGANEYVQIAKAKFRYVECHITHDLLRIPYTHLIMRCAKQPNA
jgi:SAM-dependent methyltransferase